MAIKRWDPVRDLRTMQERMNELFDGALARSSGGGGIESMTEGWQPPMDLLEESDRYLLLADLPGVAPGDVDLKIDDGVLYLRGERKSDAEHSRESHLRVERPQGRFAIQIALPSSVDAQGVRATHRNGVIEIALPKRQPSAPNQIRISSD